MHSMDVYYSVFLYLIYVLSFCKMSASARTIFNDRWWNVTPDMKWQTTFYMCKEIRNMSTPQMLSNRINFCFCCFYKIVAEMEFLRIICGFLFLFSYEWHYSSVMPYNNHNHPVNWDGVELSSNVLEMLPRQQWAPLQALQFGSQDVDSIFQMKLNDNAEGLCLFTFSPTMKFILLKACSVLTAQDSLYFR